MCLLLARGIGRIVWVAVRAKVGRKNWQTLICWQNMPCDDECKSKQVKSFSHDPDPNAFVRVRLRLQISGSAFISCHFHPLGQLILKCLFGILNSPKNKRKNLTLLILWYLKSNCFRSFFGRIKDTPMTFRNSLTFNSPKGLVFLDQIETRVCGPIFVQKI